MNRRIDILRSLEVEAYRVAYYLLEAEEPACEAAKRALLVLHSRSELPAMTAEERRALMKRLVMKEAVAGFGNRMAEAN